MTDADKKLLTEWLGECWHEWTATGINIWWCETCDEAAGVPHRLDFTDWRVVGRLIEKITDLDLRGVSLEKDAFGYWNATIMCGDAFGGPFIEGQAANNPQDAICAAVLAYLEDKP